MSGIIEKFQGFWICQNEQGFYWKGGAYFDDLTKCRDHIASCKRCGLEPEWGMGSEIILGAAWIILAVLLSRLFPVEDGPVAFKLIVYGAPLAIGVIVALWRVAAKVAIRAARKGPLPRPPVKSYPPAGPATPGSTAAAQGAPPGVKCTDN